MKSAMGITVHTGWGACVVVAGSLAQPQVIASTVVAILPNGERFCFHRAAEMDPGAGMAWIERMREKALLAARRQLAPLTRRVGFCAVVAKEGEPDDLATAMVSHPRIHTAEGCFYRDIFRLACALPVRIVAPSSLDASRVGRLAAPPWGRDQKLAALAAWSLLGT
jgi:hypothetical protein